MRLNIRRIWQPPRLRQLVDNGRRCEIRVFYRAILGVEPRLIG
jgi:hypothetical protein